MDEATWYLDSDDSSPLGSPSTPPALNGEWCVSPKQALAALLLWVLWGGLKKPAGRADHS